MLGHSYFYLKQQNLDKFGSAKLNLALTDNEKINDFEDVSAFQT